MIGFNGDDPLDPNAKKSLIDGLSGGAPVPPRGGILDTMTAALKAPSPGGLDSIAGGRYAKVPGALASKAASMGVPSGGTAAPVSVPGLAPDGPTRQFDPAVDGSEGPGGIMGNLPPANPVAPPQTIAGGNDIFSRSYSSGTNIDNSGKNKFGRFKAALGHDPSDDEIRQFVAAHPDEWEDAVSPNGEYVFRQKQGFLNDPKNLDSKTGATTIWQNRHFVNAAGSGDGYAPPYEEHQAELPGAGSYLDPMIAGNPMGNIQDALAAVQRPGTIQEIIARLQKGA